MQSGSDVPKSLYGLPSYIQITEADVNAVIKSLKTGKAPGEGDIRPEMLNAMNIYGVRWLTRIVEPEVTNAQCDFRSGRSTMDQIYVLQQIFEKSSWEYGMQKRSMHVLLILKKHIIAFLETSSGRYCCSMALMASY